MVFRQNKEENEDTTKASINNIKSKGKNKDESRCINRKQLAYMVCRLR